LLILASLAALAQSADLDTNVADSREAVKAFGPQLKQALQSAMKSGGPVNAIQVCNVQAPVIADSVSKEKALHIGRTSLKYRNPGNKPDDWEQQVLETFDSRLAAGEDPAKMEFYEVVSSGSGQVFRYMKAIPTDEVCLACHGVNLDPAVAAELDTLYPSDLARGYSEGDIRGAFTVEQEL
jgi:hypothetical protein